MTNPSSHLVSSRLLGAAAAFLCLGALATGCGGAQDARPADARSSLRTTLPHGCPDGSDLHLRFADVDGELAVSGRCGDAESMGPDREPDRQGLPEVDRMRPDREPDRQGLPEVDR